MSSNLVYKHCERKEEARHKDQKPYLKQYLFRPSQGFIASRVHGAGCCHVINVSTDVDRSAKEV